MVKPTVENGFFFRNASGTVRSTGRAASRRSPVLPVVLMGNVACANGRVKESVVTPPDCV